MTVPTRPTARLLATTAAIPLLSTALSFVLLLAWRSDLPDPVASHWGLDGAADGFSSVTGLLWLLGLLGAAGLAAGLFAGRSEQPALARVLGATGAGTVVFVDVLVLLGTSAQRGADDATAITFAGWWIVGGAAAGLLAAALVAVLVPTWQGPAVPAGSPATPLALGADERAVWTAAATSGRAGTVVGAVAVAVTVALTVVTRSWWLLTVPVLLTLLLVAMLSIRVTVDPTGLRVRGRLGWPRTFLPLDRIASVSTVQVRALRDFGGWGYRFAATGPLKGTRGFVLHSGPAILATTVDGRSEIVVVDGAATGAALLEAYRSRAAA